MSRNEPADQVTHPLPQTDANEWQHRLSLPNGLTFFLQSRQMLAAAEFLKNEIFKQNRYSRPGFEIAPGDCVVDIGANMGMFVAWAAPQAREGRVIAIEPTSVLECLTYNARINQLENVTAIQKAVGVDGETLDLVEYPDWNIMNHNSAVSPKLITKLLAKILNFRYHNKPVQTQVECVSLGRIMDEYGLNTINYLKIDCEGGEYTILESLSKDEWRRIEKLALEFHEYDPTHRVARLVTLLEGQGFQVEVRKPWFDYYFMKFGELWAIRQ